MEVKIKVSVLDELFSSIKLSEGQTVNTYKLHRCVIFLNELYYARTPMNTKRDLPPISVKMHLSLIYMGMYCLEESDILLKNSIIFQTIVYSYLYFFKMPQPISQQVNKRMILQKMLLCRFLRKTHTPTNNKTSCKWVVARRRIVINALLRGTQLV